MFWINEIFEETLMHFQIFYDKFHKNRKEFKVFEKKKKIVKNRQKSSKEVTEVEISSSLDIFFF